MSRTPLIHLLLAFTTAAVCGRATAQPVWYVDAANCPGPGTGTMADPFCRIQSGMDAASDGHEVRVAPGPYHETVDFLGKSIALRSTGGAATTTIDGFLLTDSVVACEGDATVSISVEGFTITGGVGRFVATGRYGGGIYVSGCTARISNCVLQDNAVTQSGGGLYGENSSIEIDNCTFDGNSADATGGAVRFEGCETAVTATTFHTNTCAGNGGAYFAVRGHTALTGSTFEGNSGRAGGGVVIWESAATIQGCRFTGNDADPGGGGAVAPYQSEVTVRDSVFQGNSALSYGGAIDGTDSTTAVYGSTFTVNSAQIAGGAVVGAAIVSSCTFRNNSSMRGGAVSTHTALIEHSDFTNNDGSALGGAIYLGLSTVLDCTFAGNTSLTGGAVWASDSDILRSTFDSNTGDEGGGMWAQSTDVSSCTFVGNAATSGGGLYSVGAGTLSGNVFEDNSASADGGGLHHESDGEILSCTFTHNRADGLGGGMYTNWPPHLTNAVFRGNHAGGNGGGLAAVRRLYASLDSNIVNSEFVGNTAGGTGGAMHNAASDLTTSQGPYFTNCTIVKNEAGVSGGGLANIASHSRLVNVVLWQNTATDGTDEIYNDPGSQPLIRYSDIEGSGGSASWDPTLGVDVGGNIDADPTFARTPDHGGDGWGDDPATPVVNEGANDDFGVLLLTRGSVCSDAGDTNAVTGVDEDLSGRRRRANDPCATDTGAGAAPIVDIGAYEFCLESTSTGEPPSSRYVSVVPANAPEPTAIRVTLTSVDEFPEANGQMLWVGPPAEYPEEDSSDFNRTFIAAKLQCDPYYHDWSTIEVVRIFGGEAIPGSQYEFVGSMPSCGGGGDILSEVTPLDTGKWGDVVSLFDGDDPGAPQPDFADIAAVVQKFLALPTAPIKAYAQLQPNVVFPDRWVDFKDIASDVAAFIGMSYVDSNLAFGPCACPSSVTCGATPCGGDAPCRPGYCVDGFCTDPCGRCTP